MLWVEKSWPEIEALNKDLPVVIPLGSCEQHGKHLPLFVDSFQVSAVADRLESLLGDKVIILPTLWLGASDHHRDFPGRLSLRPRLYTEVIQALAGCVLDAGFSRLHFLNGHGGNLVPVSHAMTDLVVTDDRFDRATIALGCWWQTAVDAMKPELHGMETPQLLHACEYETSLMMAIREDLVHLSRIDPKHIEVDRTWTVGRWANKLEGFHRFHRWTSTGHMSKPEVATADKGRSLLNAVSEEIAVFLQDFSRWEPMKPLK